MVTLTRPFLGYEGSPPKYFTPTYLTILSVLIHQLNLTSSDAAAGGPEHSEAEPETVSLLTALVLLDLFQFLEQ